MAGDKPSNQKSGINILSGNAKTSGGDQSFVGSWAAPITDNGMGQLAQGFNQAAAGVTQLAGAYAQRRKETEDFDARMAATKASMDLAIEQNKITSQPYNEADPDTHPDVLTKGFMEASKPIIDNYAQGLKTDAQKRTYQQIISGTQSSLAVSTNTVGYQQALQLNTGRVVQQTQDLETRLMEVATQGDFTQWLAAASMGTGTLQTLAGKLPPAQATATMAKLTETLTTQASVAMTEQVRKAPAGAEEKVIADAISMLDKNASFFGQDPAKFLSLKEHLVRLGTNITKEKMKLVKEQAEQQIDLFKSDFGSLQRTGPLPKLTQEQFSQLSPEKQAAYMAGAALSPLRDKVVALTQNHAPASEVDIFIEQAKSAVEALPDSYRAAGRDMLDSLLEGVVTRASDPDSVRAQAAANGANGAQQMAAVMKVNGGNVTEAQKTVIGKDTISAAQGNIYAIVQNGGPVSGAQVRQEISGFLGKVSEGVSVQGVSPAMTAYNLLSAGQNAGFRRVLAIQAIMGDVDLDTQNALVSSAYRGPSAIASAKGLTNADVIQIKNDVRNNPEIQAIQRNINLLPSGSNDPAMVDFLVDAIVAAGLSAAAEGKVDLASVKTNTAAIALKVGDAYNKTPEGIRLGAANKTIATSQFTTDGLLVPPTVMSDVTSTEFRKGLSGIVSSLIGVGKNPVSIRQTALKTSPDNTGILITYKNDLLRDTPLVNADGTVRVIKWAEIKELRRKNTVTQEQRFAAAAAAPKSVEDARRAEAVRQKELQAKEAANPGYIAKQKAKEAADKKKFDEQQKAAKEAAALAKDEAALAKKQENLNRLRRSGALTEAAAKKAAATLAIEEAQLAKRRGKK